MKPLSILCLFLIFSCTSKQETITLADLRKGERAEIIAIEIEEAQMADSALHNRLLRRIGAKVGVVGIARGPKQAQRGINYGFDPENGNYFGLYEPHASMVKVKRIQ